MKTQIVCRTDEQLVVHQDEPACKCGCHLSVVDLSAKSYRRECYKCGDMIAMELPLRGEEP
jgi:hypothetical protein